MDWLEGLSQWWGEWNRWILWNMSSSRKRTSTCSATRIGLPRPGTYAPSGANRDEGRVRNEPPRGYIMVVMPRSSAENAAKLVDAVRAVIQAEPPELDGKTLPYTVSAGVVGWQVGEDLGSVLSRAEDAARAARAAGGDRVVLA